MIGYYIHHQGSGHLHRALAIDAASTTPFTGLSSQPRPTSWSGDWVELADDAGGRPDQDLSAGGVLHYVPTHHPGLRTRMAQISAWLDRARPQALVVDVSVEVALLARLHGVPVVVVALPGQRTDAAHQLGYDVAHTILAPWPAEARAMSPGLTPTQEAKTEFVGAIARYPVADPAAPVVRRVVVLNGTGGPGPSRAEVARARSAAPDWEWIHLDREAGTWVDDPWPLVSSAAVVVSHTGQNAVAEIAAARRPAVLIPQDRPYQEQQTTAQTLHDLAWVPAVVRQTWPPAAEWPQLLDGVSQLDGSRWSGWNDGHGAARAARLIAALASTEVEVSA